jgi:hypothetical protein
VEVESSASGKAGADSQRNLAMMKNTYNEARHLQGLEAIQ